LRQSITHENPQSFTNYLNQGAWLYDMILRDPLSIFGKNKVKKLIIIPDGILNYVPFEMLFNPAKMPQSNWADIPFLMKDYTISYANSSNLLSQQLQHKPHSARNLFAGFAAQYKPNDAPTIAMRAALTRDNAYDLPYAQKEVVAIQAMVGGTLFTQNASNESNFKAKANQFRILHFAMHAVPDSLNPTLSKLLFTYNAQDTIEDNDLTAAELYSMHLNADLAILSACQTGYGKINRGEGVMSLARAFTYAGVPATVVSLWKVPDNTTQEIMITFYKNLKAGQSKDEALRNAKQTFLSNHAESSELQNPFYWAGFVAVGNMNPIDMSPPNQMLWIVSCLLILFVGTTLFLRYKKDE
jgi:CHAT domain-containing protein